MVFPHDDLTTRRPRTSLPDCLLQFLRYRRTSQTSCASPRLRCANGSGIPCLLLRGIEDRRWLELRIRSGPGVPKRDQSSHGHEIPHQTPFPAATCVADHGEGGGRAEPRPWVGHRTTPASQSDARIVCIYATDKMAKTEPKAWQAWTKLIDPMPYKKGEPLASWSLVSISPDSWLSLGTGITSIPVTCLRILAAAAINSVASSSDFQEFPTDGSALVARVGGEDLPQAEV